MTEWKKSIDPELLASLGPSVTRELLERALDREHLGGPPAGREVYTSRALRMEKIRWIGFDLDWTLADYDQHAMSELAFRMILESMIEKHGYPEEILKAEYRGDFARRGLMLDTEAGMVLKMNRHRYVGRAYYGHKFLDNQERSELYRRDPINPASDRFYLVDTLFELPEVNIFAELVELGRRKVIQLDSYMQLFDDIHASVDRIHADGSLKAEILKDLAHYLPRDPEMVLALKRLSFTGRRLLLITNSEYYYTDALCTHLFDGILPGLDHWRQVFDLVVVDACKPNFFRKEAPFVELDRSGKPIGEFTAPRWDGVYSGGSRAGLMELLGGHGEQMLYVGDHIYGDVLSTKKSSMWRTALIVREMEEELRVRRKMAVQLRHRDVLRAELATLGLELDDLRDVRSLLRSLHGGDETQGALDPLSHQIGALTKEHRYLRQHVRRLQTQISQAVNPYWGSLFKQGANKTFFGNQVEDFACVYTSRVSNFAFYGSEHYYRVRRDDMMHEVEI